MSDKAKNGNKVKVHYKGTLTDGSVFDDSYERGEPLGFEVGSGQLIKGFDVAVEGMTIGETKSITLKPDEAYGEVDPEAFMEVPRNSFPSDFAFVQGEGVRGESPAGNLITGTIFEVDEEKVILDMNHPMAGKDLTFEIELVEIEE